MILSLLRGRIPGQLVVQYTDRCNAACPQCGMRRTESFPRATLGLDNAHRIIDAAAARGVKAISFTGGEPLLYLDDVVCLIDHAAAAGIPLIRTGTNRFLFMGSERPDFEQRIHSLAKRLALTRRSLILSPCTAIACASSHPAAHCGHSFASIRARPALGTPVPAGASFSSSRREAAILFPAAIAGGRILASSGT